MILRDTLENLIAYLIEQGEGAEVVRIPRDELEEVGRRVTLDLKWQGDYLVATTLDNDEEIETFEEEEPESAG